MKEGDGRVKDGESRVKGCEERAMEGEVMAPLGYGRRYERLRAQVRGT